jgi:hypothetical protein
MWRSLVSVVALLLAAVAGCGGGDTESQAGSEDYCRSLKSAQQEFGALESGQLSGANLDKIFNRMHSLADQAPEPVADDWQKLDDGISKMQSGLKDLGLSFGDLSDPEKLQDVDPQKLQKFGQEMQKIGGQQFQQAGEAIERHAKQECGIDLSKS